MTTQKILRYAFCFSLILFGVFAAYPAHASIIIAQQTDGSLSGSTVLRCNTCANITAGSQPFIASISGALGSIAVFTSGFGTMSRNADTNDCYMTVSDQDTGALLARSDNGFNGSRCGGDLVFTFKDSRPFLHEGNHYRWDFIFGGLNWTSIAFAGSADDTAGGSFSVPPLVNAEFKVFAALEPPESLVQFLADGATTLAHGGISGSSAVTLGATLSSLLPDLLHLQIELKPSYVAFTGEPNMESQLVSSGSTTQIGSAGLPNGGYHWQARAADADGNTSLWQASDDSAGGPDFVVYDPAQGIILQDMTTIYGRSAQPVACMEYETMLSCALFPFPVDYRVGTPFTISKIIFNWSNGGYNNCDDVGHYGAVITASAATDDASLILATSTNTAYLGCAGPTGQGGAAELDFNGETIPANFHFSLAAFDKALQGGSAVSVSRVTIYGTPSAPAETQREPVVIVPGMLGSRLDKVSDGQEVWPDANAMLLSGSDSYLDDLSLSRSGAQISGMEMTPSDIIRTVTTSIPFSGQDFYGPLLDSLVSMGYREGTDLFVAPYDWRLDIASSAASIDPVIRNAIAHSPDGKIDIVAHSMGGLVIRDYLSHTADTSFVNKLVLAGIPQLGAPQMFKALEYGDDLGFHVGPFELLDPAEVKSISQNMPAAYELLPSRRYDTVQGGYVTDNRNGDHTVLDFGHINEFLLSSSTDPRNPMLLAQADLFHVTQDGAATNAPEVYNIVGCQNPSTAYGFVLGDGGDADIVRGAGDGTVPVFSAMNLANDYRNYFSLYSENGVDHAGLVRDRRPIALIDAILGNATSTLDLNPLGISTSTQDCLQGRSQFHGATTIEISAYGAIALNVYDSEGRHSGPSDASEDGTSDLQIPGSDYQTIGENSFILLPASDTYRIVGVAKHPSFFTMKIKSYGDTADILGTTSYVQVPLASSSTIATLTVSSSTLSPAISLTEGDEGNATSTIPPTAVLSPTDGADVTPPVITMPEIAPVVSFGTPITFAFSATDDLSGIASIAATLDGTTIENGTILKDIPAGTHTFRLEAVDSAGNPRIGAIVFQVTPMTPATTTGTGTGGSSVIQVPVPPASSSSATTTPRCKKKTSP
ncbi:MAG: hypothetical protein P4L67_01335 [Candidatus Pacebacteria bacterium]|nr:hypothetical protein [Candidatus Paceibacterota bacterium]